MQGFKQLEHQAAGHPGVLVDTQEGKLFAKPTSESEIGFYSQINSSLLYDSHHDLLGSQLIDWIPRFVGRLESGVSQQLEDQGGIDVQQLEEAKILSVKQPHGQFIVLQNLLFGFKLPSILDIKLGSVLVDESASEDKRARLTKVAQATTSGSLSFRICGMKMPSSPQLHRYSYNRELVSESNGYITFNKFFGRSFTADNIVDGLELFFRANSLTKDQQTRVIEMTNRRLQLLYNCLIDQEARMISTSVFIVYENDAERWATCEDSLIRQDFESDDSGDEGNGEDQALEVPLSSLNLIDFAHSKFVPGKGPDDNILTGIENLLATFEKLMNR